MRLLFIGDIVGRSGREALEKFLPKLKKDLEPDTVIVNGENAAHGFGITEKITKQFLDLGVDCVTTGNHIWDQREIISYIVREPRLLRPVNYPEGTPGKGVYELNLNDGRRAVIINVMGRLFMDTLDDPFKVVEKILAKERLGETADAIFVDFHGEATSEKIAFAHYFDGRISAMVGTHTHVPTADYHVMDGGTAYMSDAGMTGDYNSVIGMDKDLAVYRFLSKVPGERLRPASGSGSLCGAYIILNDETGLAERIEPIRLGGNISKAKPVKWAPGKAA